MQGEVWQQEAMTSFWLKEILCALSLEFSGVLIGVLFVGLVPEERHLRIWVLLNSVRQYSGDRGLKHTPLATFEYAWLHRRLQRNIQRLKKNSLTEDFEDVQGNKIVALDPSQEADEVLTRSSKPVAKQFSGLGRFWSNGFWQLDLAGPCSSWVRPTFVKISSTLPSSQPSTPASHARGSFNDSSDEDLAPYDGDHDCCSYKDERV